MQKIIIAAVSRNGVIGKGGSIPWHSKAEMQFFKNTTMGYPIIMGRKTFQSLKKPLPGRLNVVITSQPGIIHQDENVIAFNSVGSAFEYLLHAVKPDKVYIIGGGEIYRQTISDADMLSISEMHIDADGDVYFPELKQDEWNECSRTKYDDFTVVVYKRK